MPEGPEITILAQYLYTILKGMLIENIDILSGKYSKHNNSLHLSKSTYVIKNINSKGKLIWFVLVDVKTNNTIYMTSH